MTLSQKSCLPCRGDVPPLAASEIEPLIRQLQGWQVVEGKKLVKSYAFKNFKEPMKLANKIAAIAEAENHHPDLTVRWGELLIELWTHAIDGLSESDFILAAKIDAVCD